MRTHSWSYWVSTYIYTDADYWAIALNLDKINSFWPCEPAPTRCYCEVFTVKKFGIKLVRSHFLCPRYFAGSFNYLTLLFCWSMYYSGPSSWSPNCCLPTFTNRVVLRRILFKQVQFHFPHNALTSQCGWTRLCLFLCYFIAICQKNVFVFGAHCTLPEIKHTPRSCL